MRLSAAVGILAVLVAAPAGAQPAGDHAAPVCIRPFDTPTGSLVQTHVVDSKTILFYMREGKVWKNTLKSPCPGLLFHGFTFVTHQDEVCSNSQGIRVIVTGEVCQLGEFTPYTPPPQPH